MYNNVLDNTIAYIRGHKLADREHFFYGPLSAEYFLIFSNFYYINNYKL